MKLGTKSASRTTLAGESDASCGVRTRAGWEMRDEVGGAIIMLQLWGMAESHAALFSQLFVLSTNDVKSPTFRFDRFPS